MKRTFACLATAALAALAAEGFAQNDYTQDDWSGGPGVPGPVPAWTDTFDATGGLAWRSIPGQIALSASPRSTPVQEIIAPDALGAQKISVGDVNGDGLNDVVLPVPVLFQAADQGAIYWLQRLPDGTWQQHQVTDDFVGVYNAVVGDLDGDGDADIAAASYYSGVVPGQDGRYAWFENLDGAGDVWATHILAHYFWGAQSVAIADLDADGDNDIVGCSSLTDYAPPVEDADVVWFENQSGDGQQWVRRDLTEDFFGPLDVHAADLDGDGDLDVIASTGSRTNWYENRLSTGGFFVERTVVADTFDGGVRCAIGDIDGDGDLDLFTATHQSLYVRWYENVLGDGTVWQRHNIAQLQEVWSVDLGDVDGDGDLDFLLAQWGGSSNPIGQSYWLENNDGTGLSLSAHSIKPDLYYRTWIVAGDIDGDGKLDALLRETGPSFPVEIHDEDLSWFDLTEFAPAGTLTGSVLDAGPSPAWSTLTWDAAVPADAELNVQVRASNDPNALGAFVTVPASGANLADLIDPQARYLQYRLDMSSFSVSASPILRSITVDGGLIGDIDGDGIVDLDDLTLLLQNFQGQNVPAPGGDVDGDGDTDVDDLTLLLQNFGAGT